MLSCGCAMVRVRGVGGGGGGGGGAACARQRRGRRWGGRDPLSDVDSSEGEEAEAGEEAGEGEGEESWGRGAARPAWAERGAPPTPRLAAVARSSERGGERSCARTLPAPRGGSQATSEGARCAAAVAPSDDNDDFAAAGAAARTAELAVAATEATLPMRTSPTALRIATARRRCLRPAVSRSKPRVSAARGNLL